MGINMRTIDVTVCEVYSITPKPQYISDVVHKFYEIMYNNYKIFIIRAIISLTIFVQRNVEKF